jgi:hypothetical protein
MILDMFWPKENNIYSSLEDISHAMPMNRSAMVFIAISGMQYITNMQNRGSGIRQQKNEKSC